MERRAAAPSEPFGGVVCSPDVERGELVDRPLVVDGVFACDLGPGANSDAIGLLNPARSGQSANRWVTVRPDAFFEGASQLGNMSSADDVVVGVLKGGEEEEAIMFERPRTLIGAIAEDEQLLAFGKRSNRDCPVFDCDWHL